MNGWIKIHKKINDWEWRSDPNTLAVFINLLIEANFSEKCWRGQKILPGQLIFGRKEFAKKTGISEQSIRTALEHLKSTNEVTIKSTNKYSVISINNWVKYQDTNQQTNQQLTNNQPATNHTLRNKEIKEYKNIYSNIESIDETVVNEIANDYKLPVSFVMSKLDDMKNWLGSKGKKYKDYKLALRNWVKKDAVQRIDHAKRIDNKRAIDLSNI